MIKTQDLKNAKTQNKLQGSKFEKLEDRLQDFFTRIIMLCKKIPSNSLTQRIIAQLIGAAGSIPANFAEATEAMSKKDFVKSIKICRKEAKESLVWLKGLKIAVSFKDSEFDLLIQEATELTYILTSILAKTDSR